MKNVIFVIFGLIVGFLLSLVFYEIDTVSKDVSHDLSQEERTELQAEISKLKKQIEHFSKQGLNAAIVEEKEIVSVSENTKEFSENNAYNPYLIGNELNIGANQKFNKLNELLNRDAVLKQNAWSYEAIRLFENFLAGQSLQHHNKIRSVCDQSACLVEMTEPALDYTNGIPEFSVTNGAREWHGLNLELRNQEYFNSMFDMTSLYGLTTPQREDGSIKRANIYFKKK